MTAINTLTNSIRDLLVQKRSYLLYLIVLISLMLCGKV